MKLKQALSPSEYTFCIALYDEEQNKIATPKDIYGNVDLFILQCINGNVIGWNYTKVLKLEYTLYTLNSKDEPVCLYFYEFPQLYNVSVFAQLSTHVEMKQILWGEKKLFF